MSYNFHPNFFSTPISTGSFKMSPSVSSKHSMPRQYFWYSLLARGDRVSKLLSPKASDFPRGISFISQSSQLEMERENTKFFEKMCFLVFRKGGKTYKSGFKAAFLASSQKRRQDVERNGNVTQSGLDEA